MDKSWTPDEEDEEFILKEPLFKEVPTVGPKSAPYMSSVGKTARDVVLLLGFAVVTYALLTVTDRVISKWLD